MARTFNHHLYIMFPGTMGQFTQGSQFSELCFVIRILHTARTQAIAEAERHIVGFHKITDYIEMGVKEVLHMMRQTPLCHYRTATRDNPGQTVRRERYIS